MSYVFNIPYRRNAKLKQVIERIKEDKKLQTYWKCSNVMAIERMGYTDHGPTHVKIVANLSLKILRILTEKKLITPSIVQDYGLKNEDAEVVVVLASIFHDLGMIVQRNNHEKYSATIALQFMNCLRPTYTVEEEAIITSEVLHAIVVHEQPPSGDPTHRILTKEAGIVGIADALDMEAGRARIPFQAGKIDIHAVSALSIEKVELEATNEQGKKPIEIKIQMSNSAGVFQIDELLKPRIIYSGLEQFFHVIAEITGEKESRIIDKFEI